MHRIDILIQFFQPHDVGMPREPHHRDFYSESVSHSSRRARRPDALNSEHVARRTFLSGEHVRELARSQLALELISILDGRLC